jgi:hypothetical protein
MKSELSSWIQSEFAGDRAALAAAAEGKNFKAEFAMMLFNVFNDDKGNNGYPVKWFDRVFNQGSSRLYEARICFRISNAKEYAAFDGDSLRREVKLNTAMRLILWPAKSGVMVAEHILGMLLYCSEGESEGCKPDILDAARWIRKAAKQGLAVSRRPSTSSARCFATASSATSTCASPANTSGGLQSRATSRPRRECGSCTAA